MNKLTELSDRYLAAREASEAAEETAKQLKAITKATEQQLIDAMTLDADGITSFKRDDGVSVSLVRKVRYGCLAEDKDDLYALMRLDKMDDLFSVNPSTLNKAMGEMAENAGGALPTPYAALVSAYDDISLSVRGRRKAG